jgi:hypothetical protein
MDRNDVVRIINAATKACQKDFNVYKINDYTIGSKSVIPFTSKTLSSRVVSSWGTDEDEDKYLWYSANGWEICWQTTQVGAGVQKVVKESISSINSEDVINNYDQMDTLQQLEFLSVCYRVLAVSEFRHEI